MENIYFLFCPLKRAFFIVGREDLRVNLKFQIPNKIPNSKCQNPEGVPSGRKVYPVNRRLQGRLLKHGRDWSAEGKGLPLQIKPFVLYKEITLL